LRRREILVRATRSLCELDIERRQGKSLVVDHLDGRPPPSEDDYQPKGRIICESRNELTRLRSYDHGLDNNAGDS